MPVNQKLDFIFVIGFCVMTDRDRLPYDGC